MLYIVELRLIGADLATSMVEMRTWFDRNGISPTEFDHSSGGPEITFRVGFRREADAVAFAEAFHGWLNKGIDPDGTALWRMAEPAQARDRLQARACDRAHSRGSARDG